MDRILLAGAAVLAAATPGCAPDAATAGHSREETAVARRAVLHPTLLLTGRLESVQSEKIFVPRTPSWQMPIRWLEQDGATVVKGQKVLELDNTQFTGELEQKKLSLSSAENNLMRKEADVAGELFDKEFALEQKRIELAKARIEADVPETLRPRREHQEYQLELARAELAYAKAEEDLETTRNATSAELEELEIALDRARAEIATAERAIEALSLTAPRDGILIVAEARREGRKFQVGDNVWVGLAVMSMPDLTAMQVVARLSDVDDGRIEIGAEAVCTIDAYPDLTFRGHVTEIAPIAQEEREQSLRRSFRVIVLLDETDAERMRPGMSVKVAVREPVPDEGLVVPRGALDLTSVPPRVLLADGSAVDVDLGACTTAECIVVGGLAVGARLRRAG